MVRESRLQPDRRLVGWQQLLLEEEDPSARRIALLSAAVLHILLLTLTLPSGRRDVIPAPLPVRNIEVSPLPVPPPPDRPPPAQVRPAALVPARIPVPDPQAEPAEPLSEPTAREAPPDVELEIGIVLGEFVPPPDEPRRNTDPGVTLPVLIGSTQVLPRYPEAARTARQEAWVILEAVVRPAGLVADTAVLRCTAPGFGFEEEAMQAVRQWRYRPGTQFGRPVAIRFTVVVQFVMQ